MQKRFIIAILTILGTIASIFGQQHTENKADQTLRGSGRVNPSTLAMEFNLPLGSYPGRGINVPVGLSYSSKLWRTDYLDSQPAVNNPDNCIAINMPKFAEDTAAGWTTSMAVPYVEYTGSDSIFNNGGFPAGTDAEDCTPLTPPVYTQNAYVKRITIHLPSGETHELRADDIVTIYPTSQNPAPFDFNQTFYAVDGSNIKYVENSSNGTYRLLMPDGSFYDFASTKSPLGSKSVRNAIKFSDRNGNFTTYNGSNNSWTDTLGRTLTAPLGLAAPATPNIQTYSMLGMTGTYKFHWKQLKGSAQADSALTDFNTVLKYMADRSSPSPNTNPRASGTYLFGSDFSAWVHDGNAPLFNPILLAEIELPTGQKYKFTYDVHGRIERIYYPTGGEERFEYGVVPQLGQTDPSDINIQTNFGVTKRQVYATAGVGTPLE